MASQRQFQLHVTSKLNRPIIENDAIIYGPLSVIKLEIGKIVSVSTGAYIAECNNNGKVVISPSDKFADKLVFTSNEYFAENTKMISVEIKNISQEFIRIEPTDHLFKYEFILLESKCRQRTRRSKEPKKEQSIEETKEEVTPAEDTPVETMPVEAAPVEVVPTEDTPVEDTPVETIQAEVSPVEDTPVEATPVEVSPVEDTPVEDTPVEDTPVEATPVEAKPVEVKSVEAKPESEISVSTNSKRKSQKKKRVVTI